MHKAANEDNVVVLIEKTQKGQLEGNIAPPYPERLALERPVVPSKNNIEIELKKLCVKIPLL